MFISSLISSDFFKGDSPNSGEGLQPINYNKTLIRIRQGIVKWKICVILLIEVCICKSWRLFDIPFKIFKIFDMAKINSINKQLLIIKFWTFIGFNDYNVSLISLKLNYKQISVQITRARFKKGGRFLKKSEKNFMRAKCYAVLVYLL